MTLRRIRFWLSTATLPVLLAAAPLAASAQTPEPAAGNPAINTTPPASGSASTMASPSNATNIPKGSNPDSGSGNIAAGSGATPSSQATDHSTTPSQTADNPNATPDQATPSAGGANADTSPMGDNTNGSNSGDGSMPQGKYASPPDLLPQSANPK